MAEEVFADRTYSDNGLLTPRKEANSMIKDPAQAVANVRRMVDEQAIYSTSGKRIPCQVDSICVHGDGPTAVAVSKAVREGLEAAGIRIVPLPEMPPQALTRAPFLLAWRSVTRSAAVMLNRRGVRDCHPPAARHTRHGCDRSRRDGG